MKNVIALNCTTNTEHTQKASSKPDREFSYLSPEKRAFTLNLIKDWKANARHHIGLDIKTIKGNFNNFERLLRTVQVAPWELKPKHVIDFFESKIDPETGETISAQTYACYCAAWRSFQNFILDMDRANAIYQQFSVRPAPFVNEENNIAVKRAKSNKSLKGWALTSEQIDLVDREFQRLIIEAYQNRSKSLLPLQRDRVMFHICIHFALRITELITLQVSDFHAHHDPRMARFENLGLLTVTGKNNVTGTVPMREPEIHELLKWYMGFN